MPQLLNDDVARLARSAERLVRLVEEISKRDVGNGALAELPGVKPAHTQLDQATANDALAHAAHDAIAAHISRPHFGNPSIFQNRIWVLMLELLLAGLAGKRMPVTNACLLLGGAQTTALRAILDLERRGIVSSVMDETDGRRRLIELSAACEAQLRTYLIREPSSGRTMRLAVRVRAHDIALDKQPTIASDGNGTAPHTVRTESGDDVVLQRW